MEGREREGPQGTVEPGPLRALLRHWLSFNLIVLTSRQVSVMSSPVSVVDIARQLGVRVDSRLVMTDRVAAIYRSVYC